MKARFLVVFIAVYFVVTSTSALAATRDACSLLTSADAQAALGESVEVPGERPSFGADRSSCCRFRSTSRRALGGKSVSLNVRYSETDLTSSFKGIGDNLKSAGFKNVHGVAGVGNAAVWGSNSVLGKSPGELTVIQGKFVMLIVIIDGIANELEALARAKAVASMAIGRL